MTVDGATSSGTFCCAILGHGTGFGWRNFYIFWRCKSYETQIYVPHCGQTDFPTDRRPNPEVEYFPLCSERRYSAVINFYSIRSKSSTLFDTPWPCENDKRAVYELRNLINQHSQSAIANDPSDHQLYRVGIFDPDSGKMKSQNDCIVKDLIVLVKKGGSDE